MIPRMQIVKEGNEILLMGDFQEEGMSLDEAREYFLNWLQSYPQENLQDIKMFYTTKNGKKEEFYLQ